MLEIREKRYSSAELWELMGESEDYQFAELIEGELLMAGSSGGEATILAAWLIRKIGNFVDEHNLGYVTGADGHYHIANDPDTDLIPDVAFVKKSRMPKPIPKKFLPLAPDLAVEVISPNDKAKEIRQKIEQYLKHGTNLLWIVYPASKRVDVYHADDSSKIEVLDEMGSLNGEDVLPNFTLAVKDIFAVLE